MVQSTEKCYLKILKILGVPDDLIEVLKKLYMDVTINFRVEEKLERFLSTSGVESSKATTLLLSSSSLPCTQYPTQVL
jgi:hypothetical protein